MSLLKKIGESNNQAVDCILSAALLCDDFKKTTSELRWKKEKDKGIDVLDGYSNSMVKV